MCGFYANTVPFYIRNLSLHLVSTEGPGTNPLWIPRGDCNHFIDKAEVFAFIPFLYAAFQPCTESRTQLEVSTLPPALMDMLWHFPVRVVVAVVF